MDSRVYSEFLYPGNLGKPLGISKCGTRKVAKNMLSTIYMNLHGRTREQIKIFEVNVSGHLNRQVRLELHALSECCYGFVFYEC